MNAYLELKRWVTEAWASPSGMWSINIRNGGFPMVTVVVTTDAEAGVQFDLWEEGDVQPQWRMTMSLDLVSSYALLQLYNRAAEGL